MRRWFVGVFSVLPLALLAVPSSASVVILGEGPGRECYLAAALKRDVRPSLDICNNALLTDQNLRDRAATFVNRGVIYFEGGNSDLALKDFAEALRIDSKLAEAHVNAGIVLLRIGGRDREAVDELTLGITKGTERVEVAYYTRAVAQEMLGNVRAAYEDYQAAAAASPEWAPPREQLKRFSIVRRAQG